MTDPEGPIGFEPTAERFDVVLDGHGVVIERITSYGNVTPPDRPWRQDHAEWVTIVAGAARVRLGGEDGDRSLASGDHLLIPAGVAHWVTYTADPTVWIAVHLPPAT